MSFPVSLIAAGVPVAGMLAKGLQSVAQASPFAFGREDAPTEKVASADRSSAPPKERAPASTGEAKLKKVFDTLREALGRAGINAGQPMLVSADGDQLPRVESEDLEVAQFAEEWFRENPAQRKELQEAVQSLRAGTPDANNVVARDPRRQTLRIHVSQAGIQSHWDSEVYQA